MSDKISEENPTSISDHDTKRKQLRIVTLGIIPEILSQCITEQKLRDAAAQTVNGEFSTEICLFCGATHPAIEGETIGDVDTCPIVDTCSYCTDGYKRLGIGIDRSIV